jgi:hypothetical protein
MKKTYYRKNPEQKTRLEYVNQRSGGGLDQGYKCYKEPSAEANCPVLVEEKDVLFETDIALRTLYFEVMA